MSGSTVLHLIRGSIGKTFCAILQSVDIKFGGFVCKILRRRAIVSAMLVGTITLVTGGNYIAIAAESPMSVAVVQSQSSETLLAGEFRAEVVNVDRESKTGVVKLQLGGGYRYRITSDGRLQYLDAAGELVGTEVGNFTFTQVGALELAFRFSGHLVKKRDLWGWVKDHADKTAKGFVKGVIGGCFAGPEGCVVGGLGGAITNNIF